MELFAKAVKQGLTFNTSRGVVLPQDVWKMPLTGNNGFNLDVLSRDLLKKVRASEEDSLVSESKVDPKDQLRLDVLKFIIEDKQEEAKAAEDALLKKQKKEKLQSLIAQKQDEEISSKSLEELQEELLKLD